MLAEQLFETPGYERRADDFIEELDKLREGGGDLRNCLVSFHADKVLPTLIRGYDKLQSLSSDFGFISDLPILPVNLADELDVESSRSCFVGLYVITDNKLPLEEFVDKILRLAKKHEARIDSQLPFGTQSQVDFIQSWNDESNGLLHHINIYFKFQ